MLTFGSGRIGRTAVAVCIVLGALGLAGPAVANAAPCPDAQLVFARGTSEAPGPGRVGQALADSLAPRIAPKSLDVFPVDYPATIDFPRAADGVANASNHIRQMAVDCPKTKMVLSGFSQGAAVIGYVTAAAIPEGYAVPSDITGPMSPDIAKHVAAVALFGEPSSRFLDVINAPPIVIGPLYAGKTINQCVVDDPVCAPEGGNIGAHSQYVENGMVDQAADYISQRLV